jgi:hypothetical protein
MILEKIKKLFHRHKFRQILCIQNPKDNLVFMEYDTCNCGIFAEHIWDSKPASEHLCRIISKEEVNKKLKQYKRRERV